MDHFSLSAQASHVVVLGAMRNAQQKLPPVSPSPPPSPARLLAGSMLSGSASDDGSVEDVPPGMDEFDGMESDMERLLAVTRNDSDEALEAAEPGGPTSSSPAAAQRFAGLEPRPRPQAAPQRDVGVRRVAAPSGGSQAFLGEVCSCVARPLAL